MSNRLTSPKAWRASGHMASLRGHDIFYVDSADDDLAGLDGGRDDRPVVLVIHGFPTAGWDFHRVWPLLVPHMRLIIPDMLGFGFSAKPCPHRYGIFEQADLLEALMDRLDLSDVHILAHDYGDTVAQELLARDQARTGHDRLFKSVCLLNGGLFPETHRARLIQKLLASPLGSLVNRLTTKSRFDKSFSAVFGPDSKPDARALDDFWGLITENDGRHVFTSLIGYMHERRINRERWVGALIHCPCPIQLINGSADPVSGAHMVARYRQIMGDRDEIRALDGVGHYPQVEQPDQVAAAYREFLDRHSAAFSSHPPQNRDTPS